MTLSLILQLIVLLGAIAIGARVGGVGDLDAGMMSVFRLKWCERRRA